MAYTNYAVGDANAVQIWAKKVAAAEREYLAIAPLMGESDNNIIKVKRDLEKGAGDLIKLNLRARLTQTGVGENEVAEGNGEALSIYQDSFYINELGLGTGSRSQHSMAQQRVPFDIREECKDALAKLNAERMSTWFFNQVCGNTAVTNPLMVGQNATLAPSTSRKIFAGSATTDEGLTSDDTFSLDLVDAAVEAAIVGDQMIEPIMVGGEKKFVMYLHPYQATALRTNSARGQWQDLRKSVADKASISDLYKGSLGEHNSVILRVSQDVTTGCNSSTPTTAVTTVRRAVLLGQCAAVMAYGQRSSGKNRYRWSEKLMDHDRKLEVFTFLHAGLKKARWNSLDFGALTVSTYAAAA